MHLWISSVIRDWFQSVHVGAPQILRARRRADAQSRILGLTGSEAQLMISRSWEWALVQVRPGPSFDMHFDLRRRRATGTWVVSKGFRGTQP